MRLALLLTPSGPRCPTLAIASVGTGVPGATEGKPSGVTGTGLAWRRTGSGEPLLLLHGLGSTQDDFAALRPALEATYDVLAVDLPGLGVSAPTSRTPTVAALTDDLEADLDLVHPDRLHILGTSLGARLALELAKRGRALSVVAVAPSGLNAPPERIYQGSVMATTRMLTRLARPVLDGMVTNRAARAALLMHLRARPWQATEEEGRAVARGFADSADFWRVLWWSVLADLPTGLDRIDCPVLLVQGTHDWIAGGQTPRFLLAVPGSRFESVPFAGHASLSDQPQVLLRLVREAVRRGRELRPVARQTSGTDHHEAASMPSVQAPLPAGRGASSVQPVDADDADEGGEPVCALHLVCPECGRLDSPPGPPCRGCGSRDWDR